MYRALLVTALLLLAACGQKGPLYQPDQGLPVSPQASPTPPPTPAAGTGVNDATAPAAPNAPASPDRSDEARKRIPRTPAPAESR